MHIIRFRSLESLAPWSTQWNALSGGVPFRCWEWQSGWWRHFGRDVDGRAGELFVLGVFGDDGKLVGIAPWYLQRSATSGAVLRFLGTGTVCSEYLSVLCQPELEYQVTAAIAEWLFEQLKTSREDNTDESAESSNRWDLLELSSVAEGDKAVGLLIDHLTEAGASVHRREGMPCWRLELPTSWDTYLTLMSKPFRRKVRRAEKDYFETGRVALHTVTDPRDLPRAFDLLIDLHQKRRQTLGNPGCFASPEFTAFHRELAENLLARGALQLQWLEIDGHPSAIEYMFYADQTLYAYQSGIDPTWIEHQPGHLASIATLRSALEQGIRTVDFLRGDEPYKSHFRATPRPIEEIRIVPPTAGARLRHGVWAAGDGLKSLIKSGLELAGVSRNAEA